MNQTQRGSDQTNPLLAAMLPPARSRSGHLLFGRIMVLLFLGLTFSLIPVSSLAAEAVTAQATNSQTGSDESSSLVPFGDGIVITYNAITAQSVAAADVDGDGDIDVISASPGDGSIRWYRNMGGQFPPLSPSPIDILNGASRVIATDLNRDGAIDIVASGIGGADGKAQFAWYRNNGEANPTFIGSILGDGLGGPASIEAADLDGDGDTDLLLALRLSNQVVWYENLGGLVPGFAFHLITDQVDGAAAVKAGDLDMDGDLDVVVAAENTDTIAWFKNDGGAPLRFSPRVIRTSTQQPSPGRSFSGTLDLADINHDGKLDVVYGSKDGAEIGWYENEGGSEPPFRLHVVSAELSNVEYVLSADVNSDGDVDLVAAGGNRVTVFENSGDPQPQFAQQDLSPATAGVQAVAAADVNGDGLLDLLAASQDDNRIIWYPNLAVHRSAFYAPQTRSVVTTGFRARMASSGDLDQDGDIDIVSVLGTQILWHQNDGQQPPTFQNRVVDSKLDGGRWVNVADMDGDGDLDIISAITNDNRIAWHENSGGATPSFSTHVINRNASGVRAALAADLDGDGDMDVYSASHGDNKIAWYENLDGVASRFVEHVVTQNAMYARSAYAADLDGDGDMDLMSASQNDGKVNWYRNNGGPTPAFTPITIGYAAGAQHIYAADMDSDGDLDILTASEFDNTIAYYENDGGAAPQFVWRPVDRSAAAVHAVLADDFDGDGDMDLVAAVERLNAFKWYENTGQKPAQFVPHLVYDKALAAHGVHIDDIDGDGDNDLIGASRDDGVIAWFENRGGNYAIDVEQATSAVNAAGQFGELAQILVAHRGRPGDADIELNSLEFTFWDGANNQLDDPTFRRLVRSVHVYRDTGDGLFNPVTDEQLVWLDQPTLNSERHLVVPMPINVGTASIAVGQTQKLFVAMEMVDVCVTPSNTFRLSMVLSSRTARDSWFRRPMLAESVASAEFNVVTGGDVLEDYLFINEFMASNNGTYPDPDEATEFPDWIEIHNIAPFAVSLGGMYLTDDLSEPTKYRIPDTHPEEVTVPAYGYLVFIADGEETQGALHTNFRLSGDGESIGLFDTDKAANRVIDVISFDEQSSDVAFGRFPSGEDTWISLGAATPGAANTNVVLDNNIYLPILSMPSPSRSDCR